VSLTHAAAGHKREANGAEPCDVAPAFQAHHSAPTKVKPFEAGTLAQVPAARPRVVCRICGWEIRAVLSVPEPSGVCWHGTCPLCVQWLLTRRSA
jgi:hypothetical protein